jgi:hypothetical protein
VFVRGALIFLIMHMTMGSWLLKGSFTRHGERANGVDAHFINANGPSLSILSQSGITRFPNEIPSFKPADDRIA